MIALTYGEHDGVVYFNPNNISIVVKADNGSSCARTDIYTVGDENPFAVNEVAGVVRTLIEDELRKNGAC